MRNALFAGVAVLGWLGMAVTVAGEGRTIASSKNFRLDCPEAQDACDGLKGGSRSGKQILAEVERIRTWLDLLRFPAKGMLLHDGDQEILLTGRNAQEACGDNAVACHRIDMSGSQSRLWLPADMLDLLPDNRETLAHEYLHSRQEGTDPGAADWLREAVATAIGEAWGIANGRATSIYPPLYRLSLDLPFHYDRMEDLSEDAGYRNWYYLLYLGKNIASEDQIGYLADAAFMKDRQYGISRNPAEAMRPFYEAGSIKQAAFDRLFPQFVAGFNNLDAYPDGGYYYYKDVREARFATFGASSFFEETYSGEAAAYAAAPVHIALEIGAADADAPPEDRLLQAEVEIADGDHLSDLTLVAEHRLGTGQHKMIWLLDGSDPPADLGFFRVVHAPAAFEAARGAAAYDLRARVSPIGVTKPSCLRKDVASSFEFAGLDPQASNWRLVSDNGKVDGLKVTPARIGKAEVRLEIDSIVTRRSGGLQPAKPRKTIVPLGSFPVVADNCMIRVRMSGTGEGSGHAAVMTYSYEGEYTEITAATGGGAVYWSGNDMAVYHDGWMDIPPQMKAMMIPKMMASTGIPEIFTKDEAEVSTGGVFFGRLPHAFSKRFAWDVVKVATGPDGKPIRRKRASCPHGGTGCTTASIMTEGIPAPIIFDAQGRPLRVVFTDGGQKATMDFEYGNWTIRRPPGW